MTIAKKRLIYGTFILVFFIAGPLLLLYASGYRYNTVLGELQKTGALTIDSHPEESLIIINGKAHKKKTPAIVTDLASQEYDISISQDGYREWKRMFFIKPSEAVFLTHVQLFKQDIFPVFVENLPPSLMRSATNFGDTYDLGAYTFSLDRSSSPYQLTSEQRFTNATSSLGVLPKSRYAFVDGPRNTVVLQDRSSNTFYVYVLNLDRSEVGAQYRIPDVLGFDWAASGDKLLYYTHFELSVLNVQTGETMVVTRLSTGIQDALWHPSEAYVLYANNGVLNVVELVDELDRQHYELVSLPEISEMVISEDGSQVYLESTIGAQSGWFEVAIQ